MKFLKKAAFLLMVSMSLVASAAPVKPTSDINANDRLFLEKNFGVTAADIATLQKHPTLAKCIKSGCPTGHSALFSSVTLSPSVYSNDFITNYEAPFPHATQANISPFERGVIYAYLESPRDIGLVKFLALYHLIRYPDAKAINSGDELKSTIIASYFLNRAQDLGSKDVWISVALKALERKLNRLASTYKKDGIKLEENHPAQLFFNETFFTKEENRYKAQEKLLDDFVNSPNNVYTSFLNVAVNNWIGGEANYDDPTLLYNFVLSGYFCFHTMDLSKAAEAAWKKDPVNNQRFRLASIVGGFSAMQRRTMAIMHNDFNVLPEIDQEHREWQQINPAFHAFSVGLALFKDNFLEAAAAWEDAFYQGNARPELITVQDRPRYTFNLEGMFVARADFSLKMGDLPAAYTYLAIAQSYMPNSNYWDYGRDAIQHRQANAFTISEYYTNDDPADDPTPFMAKRHKWGGGLDSVCQVCHQRQSKVWSQEDIDTVLLAPDDILTIGSFPERRTTWYGSIK